MKNRIIKLAFILGVVYLFICGLLYFFQEKIIFHPKPLDKSFTFELDKKDEELFIRTNNGDLINGLLFRSDSSKGLIFYLHGNAGNLSSWATVAATYTALNYDVFIFDHRGYGKSEGVAGNQQQMFDDNQIIYNEMLKRYSEDKIILLGYSIGIGFAAKLAATNHPGRLILQAPYYSLIDLMKQQLPIIPTFILKYPLETNKYLKDCHMPIGIFHGLEDEVIYFGSSLKLQKEFKAGDTLFPLKGQKHNGMTNNEEYKAAITKLLNP